MTDLQRWLAEIAERDEHLYQQYGKELEKHHVGKYVAIGSDGRKVLGTSAAAVLREALEVFGSGKFAFRRVGHNTFGQWLTIVT